MRGVETALTDREMLCAGRFTVCDISVGYALMLAETLDLAGGFGPSVAAYWHRLQDREGYRRAVAAEAVALERQKVPGRPW